MNITHAGAFSQGYIFIAPYQHPGAGPYIYDKFGNLVWDGFGIVGSANVHDFKVCQYLGTPHLCITQANQQAGYAVGQDIIVDSNYRIVATVQTGRDAMPADQHEFQLIDGASPSGIMTSYRVISYDMTSYGIDGQGWLLEGMFQEVDVQTGEVLFEWYSTNHVDPSMSQIKPNTTDISGDGLTPATAFDYFHINSIDKSSDGNYLVSGRHTSTIYYVNGTDMSTIWQLSFQGQSDFQCTNFNFSYQHDVRILSQNDTTMDISMFDNAHNCYNQTSIYSSGRFITLDMTKMTATETRRTMGPNGGIASCSQGNTQSLANGHVFNGWGDKAWISERDGNNDLVLAGTFTATPDYDSTAMSYRSFSFEWESTPNNTKPSVYSYALNSDSSTNTIYVSWNGATTVANWRFYGAATIGDNFDVIGRTGHAGFETMWRAPKYYAWVMVEALGPDGTSLGNSSYQPTFVPSETLATYCNDFTCQATTSYSAMR